MQRHYSTHAIFDSTDAKANEFGAVYAYLFAGIILLIAVFLFLPRAA